MHDTFKMKYAINLQGIVFIVLGCLLMYLAFPEKKLRPDELTTLKEPVVSGIEIYYGQKGARAINLKLQSHPDYYFAISGPSFGAIRASKFVSTVKPGDTLFVDIETEVYNKELMKTVPLSFSDKLFHSKRISMLGLRDKNNTYLTLPEYNRVNKKSLFSSVVVFLLGLLFTGLGVWFSIKRTDQSSYND